MQFEQTESVDIQANPPLEYEQCEFCSRSFFKGKLKYHIKLCTADAPMIISPKRSARLPKITAESPSKINQNKEKICQYCHARLPPFLIEKHSKHCPPKKPFQPNSQVDSHSKPKSSTQVNFKGKSPMLPVIKKTVREGILKEPYQVKVREELSCFRMAQQIKQQQCPNCNRIFSKEASLRHFPICQALFDKQRFSIALRRKGNRSVGEQHTAHKSIINKRQSEDITLEKRGNFLVNPQSCENVF